MKCPNCRCEIGNLTKCPYCGASIRGRYREEEVYTEPVRTEWVYGYRDPADHREAGRTGERRHMGSESYARRGGGDSYRPPRENGSGFLETMVLVAVILLCGIFVLEMLQLVVALI